VAPCAALTCKRALYYINRKIRAKRVIVRKKNSEELIICSSRSLTTMLRQAAAGSPWRRSESK